MNIRFWILWILLFPICGFAQKVSVSKIDDSRSTGDGYFNNRCTIEFRISGEEVRKYAFAKLLQIEKAVDDRENDLYREPDSFGGDYKKKDETSFKIEYNLLNPSRQAQTIKELSGTLRLFKPSVENGGIVMAKAFSTRAGENLLPKNTPLQIMYMNKEAIMKYNSENEARKKEELSKLSPEMASGIEQLIDAFSGLFGGQNDENSAYFMTDGETESLVSMRFIDENGEEINNSGYSKSGNITQYYLQEMPKESWSVEFMIETKDSVVDLPFQLKDLELP